MSQQASQQPDPPEGLVLPPKQRFKRSLDQTLGKVAEQPPQQGVQIHFIDSDEEEEFGCRKKQSPKLVRYTTSKIAGVANPRRPRIGPEYQAVIPDWTGPK